jgi:hypothetical protein
VMLTLALISKAKVIASVIFALIVGFGMVAAGANCEDNN